MQSSGVILVLDYWYCPDSEVQTFVPYGDETGINPNELDSRGECLRVANDMIENAEITDPCNPDRTPAEIVAEALGGHLGMCNTVEGLFAGLNNYFENLDCISDCTLENDLFNNVFNAANNLNINKDCLDAYGVSSVIDLANLTIMGLAENCDEGTLTSDKVISVLETFADEGCAMGVPASCLSFSFEDFGLFQVSQLEGIELSFFDTGDSTIGTPPASLQCPFEIQTTLPTEFYFNGGVYPISTGMAANVAADAINSSVGETVIEIGEQGDFNNQDCDTVGDLFLTIVNIEIEQELIKQVNSHYNINIPLFTNADTEVGLNFDTTLGITPTQKVGDFTIFGFLKDNCLE